MDSDNKWRTFPTDPRLKTFPTDPRLKPFSRATGTPAPVLRRSEGSADLKSPRVLKPLQPATASLGRTSSALKKQAQVRALELCCCDAREDGSDFRRPDGTADLQLAVDRLAARGGGLLWLPPCGDYILTRPLVVQGSNISIVGGGPGTVIRPAAAFGYWAILQVSGSSGSLSLRDMRLVGSDTVSSGLSFQGHHFRVSLDRVDLEGFRGAALEMAAYGDSVELNASACRVASCGKAGYFKGLAVARFMDCLVEQCGAGFDVVRARPGVFYFSGCRVERCDGAALVVNGERPSGHSMLTMSGCDFIGNGHGTWANAQVEVGPENRYDGLQASGCSFDGLSADRALVRCAVALFRCGGALISGNLFAKHAGEPVWVESGCRPVSVVANVPSGPPLGGVLRQPGGRTYLGPDPTILR